MLAFYNKLLTKGKPKSSFNRGDAKITGTGFRRIEIKKAV
jgi:hypothetical protein